MPSECSLGGFYLRKCASDQRPPVKAGTKPGAKPQGSSKVQKSVQPKKKGRKGVIDDDDIPDEPKPKKTRARKDPAAVPTRSSARLAAKGVESEGGAMPTIPLKEMSANQRSRLRNGHPVRVAMGSGADGCSCKMKEENIKKVMRKKGGAATIKLDADEIRENKISGSGIMSGARKAAKELKEKAGGAVKIGKAKFGKPSVDRAKKNLGIGGAIGAVQKEQVEDAIKEGRSDAKELIKRYAQQSKLVAQKIKKKKTKTPEDIKTLEEIETGLGNVDRMVDKVKGITDATKTMLSTALDYITDLLAGEEDFLSPAEKEAKRQLNAKQSGKGLRYGEGGSLGYGMMGGAIGRSSTASQITNVGAGGNILGPMQASKAPQASSANWFFSTQFPPAMAREIRG